jgi:tetratricopeptide (TPR) repeat protein
MISVNRAGDERQRKWRLFSGLTAFVVILTHFSPPGEAQDRIEDFDFWVGKCEAWQTMENKEEAIASCDNALKISPNQANLWLHRGDIFFDLENHPEAIASYRQVVRIEPRHSYAWTRQCISLTKLEDQSLKAAEACEIALRVDSDWRDLTPAIAWNYRGVAQKQIGKPEDALFSFDWSSLLNPDYSEAWSNRCLMLYELGNYQEALSSCDAALQSNQYWDAGTPVVGWINRGRVAQALGWYEEALKAYNRALALDDKNYTLWTEHGILLGILGRFGEAQASYEWAVKLNETSSFALVNQCSNFNRLKNYEEALTACEKALQEGDGQWGRQEATFAWVQHGNALTGLGRHEEALGAYNRAIALRDNSSDAWSNRSVALWYLGRFQEAQQSNERAIALNVNSSFAWYNQGRVLTTLGQLEEALAAYSRALRGDAASLGNHPLLSDIWINHSAILFRLQRYEEAIASAENAIAITPQSSEAWYNKALAQMAANRYPEAIMSFDRAIALNPENPDLWAGKGISLRSLQRYAEAKASLDKALELNPNHPQALLNLELVQQQLQLGIEN